MNYIKEAKTTDIPDYERVYERLNANTQIVKFLHAAMGICTESGELMDALKKHLIYGKPIDNVNVQEEAGDLFWYVAILADAFNFTFEDTMEKNIAKLKARYPNRFTEKDAQLRDLDKERKILEEPRTAAGSLD
jgi:NTP pyrophosphatase (non-canonical NTP hydrolase)